MKKKQTKRGEEKGRKKRTERGLIKECVAVLFPQKPFFCQGGELESCGDLSWEDLLDKPEDLSDRVSEAWVVVPVVLDVSDVPVSLLLWSLSFCDGFSCCSDWEFVEPQHPECERLSDHCKDAAVPGRK